MSFMTSPVAASAHAHGCPLLGATVEVWVFAAASAAGVDEPVSMSQLRLDPLTGRWVVIAGERSARPSAFLTRRLPVEDDPGRPCPFCVGGEDETTPPALESYGPNGQWQVRIVANRYPAFGGTEPMVVTHLGPVFTQAPASGVHEVFVISPEHNHSWADLSESHAAQVMNALRDRMSEHASIPGLRYSQAVVNSGREAGASLEHPHGQLLSMPFVPGEAASELAGFARFQGNCLLCAVIDAEEEANHRLVHADDDVVVISPFWSGTPYEMLVIPRQHGPHLFHADANDLASVGRSVQRALAALRSRLGEVAYNVMFHSAPYRVSGDFHWHVHIVPKVTTRGGFELGSGVLINVVYPERAAEELRTEVAAPA
jgi:UDPglucose--hexose-1-phosphate uridylyltransferase